MLLNENQKKNTNPNELPTIDKFNNQLIFDYIKEEGISKNEFCRRCGLAKHTVNRILSGDQHINLRTLLKVAQVLNLEISDLFILK